MFFNPFILAEKVLVGTEKLNATQIIAMTIIGLLVVFSALLILVIYLTISDSIFRNAGKSGKPKKPSVEKKPAPAKPAPSKTAPVKQKPAPKPAPAAPASSEDEDEVVAVIMAAIAAMGEADGTQYKVRSVKQVTRNNGKSAWAQAGRVRATQPF
ncbi:MAG: OadG family protein [Oscillospiraceae bacterium]|nr:OadG family protein [Oscillospiraceae bacterium]